MSTLTIFLLNEKIFFRVLKLEIPLEILPLENLNFDLEKFDSGNLCMITGGHNLGRVGVIASRDRHPGSFDIVHVKDATGATFATRLSNVFIIGRGKQARI